MNTPNGLTRIGAQSIAVKDVDAKTRLRPVDPNYVSLLAENIEQVGYLRQPIEVRKTKKGWQLIAGGHRLAAITQLGWTEVEAVIFEGSDTAAKLAEIDENLIRHDLNPLDRAVFLAQRKEVYELLHPEAKRGGDRSGQTEKISVWSFAKDTADKCGLTDRAIRLAVMIARNLPADIRAAIAGTDVARKQSELLALVKVDPALRAAVVTEIQTGRATSVAAAVLAVRGGARDNATPATEAQVAALRKAWDRAGKVAIRAWVDLMVADNRMGELEELVALIRPPVAPAKKGAKKPAQIDLEEAIAASGDDVDGEG